MGKKSKSTSEPWAQAQPFITDAASSLQRAYGANQGQIQGATDQITSLIPSMVDKYNAGDAGVNAARGYNVDVLSGNYLDGNPHTDEMIKLALNDSTNATQAALGLKGLSGGSSYADIISKNNANTALGYRFNDYNNERNRMATAAGQSPGIASADYLSVTPLLATLGASTTPIQAAAGYAGGLGGLLGGYQTQTQKKSPWDAILSGLGSAAGAYAASERRVKTNINKVGEMLDGLGVYTFNYVWDAPEEPLRGGVMVDEVQELRPWALGPVVDGIQTVDYSKLELR